MSHYVELQVGRTSSSLLWDGSDGDASYSNLTFAKEPRIAELMLFDASSLRVVEGHVAGRDEGPYDLISDCRSALARYRRRLPQVCEALAWNGEARATLTAFGQFFADTDWPYVRLDTSDYRIVLGEDDTFDADLAFAVTALDRPVFDKPGAVFGGPGRYSPEWERLLNICLRRGDFRSQVEAVYRGDDAAFAPLSGTPHEWARMDEAGNLLSVYLRAQER